MSHSGESSKAVENPQVVAHVEFLVAVDHLFNPVSEYDSVLTKAWFCIRFQDGGSWYTAKGGEATMRKLFAMGFSRSNKDATSHGPLARVPRRFR